MNAGLGRDEIAALVARDIPRGSFVNLGIGLPTLVADHLTADAGVVLHTENGMLNQLLGFFGMSRQTWLQDPALAMVCCILPGV